MEERAKLEVALLGAPTFEVDGHPVAADTRKASALLAYLAVEGPTRRDTLAALLWPDSADSQARATLRRTLSAVRSAMGPDVVDSDRQQVRLSDLVQTDIAGLRDSLVVPESHDHGEADVCRNCIPALTRATELYRGDFLEGFSLRGAPEFEDWARTTAESYRLACETAYEKLATAYAADGDFRSAIEAVNGWLELDPLREPAYRQLMLLHAWAGDRVGATEAYRRCVATMDRELGVAPLEETSELHEAILEEDLPPAPGPRRRVVAKTDTPRELPGDLIDREEALETLTSVVTDLTGGKIIRIVGDAWMGKTRLLEELTSQAQRHRRQVTSARGFRAERQLPYGVLSQLLSGLVEHEDWDSIVASVPDWALREAGRIHPAIGTPPSGGGGDPFGETRLYDAVLTVLSAKPLLILVDDVQWIDAASASIVAYLAHRIEPLASSLVIAHRPDDSAPLETVLDAVQGGHHQDLTLAPLTSDQLIGLVSDEDEAVRMVSRTGGIPALVAEAVANSDSEEIPGVRRFMEARLLELDDLTHQILAAAAVLSGTCTLDLLRETCGRSEEEVTTAVEALVAKRILGLESGGGFGFALDSLENLVYEETNLVRRRILHRRAALALQSSPRSSSDPVLAMSIARHHQQAGEEDMAAERYVIAGDLAQDVFASDEAIDAYRSAIALGYPDLHRVHLQLGEALLFKGLFTKALAEFQKAAARSRGSARALAEHRIGEANRRLGRVEAAVDHFELAQPDHPDPVALHCDWALAAVRAGDLKGAREQADRAVVAADKTDSRGRSRALAVLGMVSGHKAEARSALIESLDLAGTDRILRMAALNALGYSYAQSGEERVARGYLEEALAIAQEIGDRHREAALWNHLADLHHRAGRTEDAEKSLTEAVKLFVEVEPGSWEPEVWLLTQW